MTPSSFRAVLPFSTLLPHLRMAVGGVVFCLTIGLIGSIGSSGARADEACTATDTICILRMTEATAPMITEDKWRDQVYRDLAMGYAEENRPELAIPLIRKIGNPDTRAMAIRAIGMGVAHYSDSMSAEDYAPIFKQLTDEASAITHPAAQGIAFTYIAMAQAFAKLDAEATETAKGMTNTALRNKAFAESAEIQAERGDLKAALASIAHIDDEAFRDKAYALTANIFTKTGRHADALAMAGHIVNPYKKTQVLLNLSATQTDQRQKDAGRKE